MVTSPFAINSAMLGRDAGMAAEFFVDALLVYASGSTAGGKLAVMFHGSSSSMRVMGWSAMWVRTSRR
jgi:hypothetical protein